MKTLTHVLSQIIERKMGFLYLQSFSMTSRDNWSGTLRESKAGQVWHQRERTSSRALKTRPKAYNLSIFVEMLQNSLSFGKMLQRPPADSKDPVISDMKQVCVYFYNKFKRHC